VTVADTGKWHPCPQSGSPLPACPEQVEVEGDDTPPARVLAHDIFPPAVPTGLQAVYSGAGQEPFVDLIWAPDTEADLAGYNVYRREEGGQPAKLNGELVKTPAYRDGNVSEGKRYSYSVSAVDLRGNESARSEEASEEVP
jgi:fibronectin type 3 domain-containing protein